MATGLGATGSGFPAYQDPATSLSSGSYTEHEQSFTVADVAGEDTFLLSFDPVHKRYCEVFINSGGSLSTPTQDEFELVGQSVVLDTAAAQNDVVTVRYRQPVTILLQIADPVFAENSRDAFVAAVAAGNYDLTADGTQVVVEGLTYAKQAGATAIPDLPDFVPLGDTTPEHFGYAGGNTTADKAAIAAYCANAVKNDLAVATLGQSNMDGVGGQTGGSMVIPEGLYVWDGNQSAGSEFTTMAEGLHPLDVTADGGVTYSNNTALAFCREVLHRDKRRVFMTQHAKGSHPIENFLTSATLTANGWTQTTGGDFVDFGSFMYDDMAAALAAMPNAPSTFDILAISLGEANAGDTVDDFKDKAAALLGDLYSAGVINDDTEILWSELPDSVSKADDRIKVLIAQAAVQCSYPNLKIVKTDGLGILVDGLHLTGKALDAYGRRFAQTLSDQPQAPLLPVVDQPFTPVLRDASNTELPSTVVGHAHIAFQMVTDEHNRPIGIGGMADVYMRFVDIDTTGGSGNVFASLENLLIGGTGNFPIVARSGAGGARQGSIWTDNVAFGGFLSVNIAGSNSFKINLVDSASGVLDTQVQVSDITNGTGDISLTINFPIKVVTAP